MPDSDPDSLLRSYLLDRRFLHSLPKRVGDTQDGEDALQDVWLHLAESPPAPRQPVNPRSYLAKSILNAVAGYMRRDKRRGEVNNELAAILNGDDAAISSERALVGKQALYSVARALEELPAQTRRILLMNRVEGCTYSEISRRLGISEQTVHYHMRRAIDHLAPLRRQIYETDAGPYG